MQNIFQLFRFSLILFIFIAKAQTGISVSPPRLYFESAAGISKTETITVTNVSTKNNLDLAISLGDWEYDIRGENQMHPANSLHTSCAAWITVRKEDAYFSLAPGERRELEITITASSLQKENLSAHTAMLYVSQMNPVDDVDSKGANIKVSIRSGIKIFHKIPQAIKKKVEITDLKFDSIKKSLQLKFENQAEIWVDGKITADILNAGNGKKTLITPVVFYTMPGNKREMEISLPANLLKGKYSASVLLDYGDPENLEMGELNFSYD